MSAITVVVQDTLTSVSVTNTVVSVGVTQTPVTLTLGTTGPQGPAGPSGVSFVYAQGTPATIWHINHNLGIYPTVIVIDSANTQYEGAIVYTDINNLTITFSAAFSGTAYLN